MNSAPARRAVRAAVLLLAGTVALSACSAFSDATGSGDSTGSDGAPSVAASFYPLEFVARRVGGELIDLPVLTGPGQEPHDLELTVAQTATVAGADLVLLEEALQPVVADAVEQNGSWTSRTSSPCDRSPRSTSTPRGRTSTPRRTSTPKGTGTTTVTRTRTSGSIRC